MLCGCFTKGAEIMLSYSKILVPVDFAKISESAVIKAANHSEASNSQLVVVYVLDPAEHNNTDGAVEAPDTADALKRANARVDRLLDRLEIGYCDKIVREGNTVDTLLGIIKDEKVDLVVMGTHSTEEPPRLVKSITAAVVAKTECDVLVLHK